MAQSTTDAGQTLHEQLRAAPIHTERLVLRLPRSSDATLVYHGYATDPDVARWMGWRLHETVATTETLVARWIDSWAQGGPALAFVIESRTDGRFLGVVDLTIGAHGAVVGYLLCRHE